MTQDIITFPLIYADAGLLSNLHRDSRHLFHRFHSITAHHPWKNSQTRSAPNPLSSPSTEVVLAGRQRFLYRIRRMPCPASITPPATINHQPLIMDHVPTFCGEYRFQKQHHLSSRKNSRMVVAVRTLRATAGVH